MHSDEALSTTTLTLVVSPNRLRLYLAFRSHSIYTAPARMSPGVCPCCCLLYSSVCSSVISYVYCASLGIAIVTKSACMLCQLRQCHRGMTVHAYCANRATANRGNAHRCSANRGSVVAATSRISDTLAPRCLIKGFKLYSKVHVFVPVP